MTLAVVVDHIVNARAALSERPLLVGLAGAVSVGKSTLAEMLRAGLTADGLRVEVVATDGFLLPNAILNPRGLLMRKGFPETYDDDAIRAFLRDARAGTTASVPVYSHAIYDRAPGEVRTVHDADVIIVEGVNALQPVFAGDLDVAIYLHADEAVVREWYVRRFLGQIELAEADESSFYRMFCDLSADERRATAGDVWDTVNGVNLHEHIAPSRAIATLVVTKGGDHAINEVEQPSVEELP